LRNNLWTAIADLGASRVKLLDDVKPFDLILGITCDEVYHAGQVQLIKRLRKRTRPLSIPAH
jgi:hypothetical protein